MPANPVPANKPAGASAIESSAVDSTAIERVEYDAAARRLWITFAGGKTYKYYEVPQGVYEGLLKAQSKGAFFNQYIRDRYDFALAVAGPSSPSDKPTDHLGLHHLG